MEKLIVQRFVDFVKDIKKDDKTAVFYHAYCTDGVCSAVLTTKG